MTQMESLWWETALMADLNKRGTHLLQEKRVHANAKSAAAPVFGVDDLMSEPMISWRQIIP